ncbi:glutamine synthetase [Pleurocapsales cyanobacterium LEGE 06147]|nr:glutamine synthetase [Pleurocapsales cyanobacterium LEGE 06147]
MESAIINSLNQVGVKFVNILWCDNANVIRGKAIHHQRLSAYFHHGVGISAAQQAVPVMYDAPVTATGLGPVGEIRLVPDWESLIVLPYAPTHARVIGNMVRDGQPWSVCPRYFLKRMATAAAEEGLEIQAAFENEFYLLQQTKPFAPADQTVFASTAAMNIHRPLVDAIASALAAQGIQVEQYYPESGPGQIEISVLYDRAVKAADNQIIFRETVRAIAFQHGFQVSFLPKIFPARAGSGCHLHLSLWQEGTNLLPTASGKLSDIAGNFIAGLLAHLPALMALTTPIPNSYRRILPHCWSGAFRCWGYDNREAAIRVPTNPESPSPTHLEFKTIDASANPYLALGAVIAAGLDGVRRHLDLSPPVSVDPGNLSELKRCKNKIDALPNNLGKAIEHLQQDEILLTALGKDLAQAYLAVRQTEWEAMKDWELEEEVKLLSQRY